MLVSLRPQGKLAMGSKLALKKKLSEMSKIPLHMNPRYQAILDMDKRRKKGIARVLLKELKGT